MSVRFNWRWPHLYTAAASSISSCIKESFFKERVLAGWQTVSIPLVNQRHFVESRRVVSDAPFSLLSFFFVYIFSFPSPPPPCWLARSPYMDLLVSWKHTNRWGRWWVLPSILSASTWSLLYQPVNDGLAFYYYYAHTNTWLNIQKRFLNWIFSFFFFLFLVYLSRERNESSFLMAHDSNIRRIAADEINLNDAVVLFSSSFVTLFRLDFECAHSPSSSYNRRLTQL